jgi:hypothetical protein
MRRSDAASMILRNALVLKQRRDQLAERIDLGFLVTIDQTLSDVDELCQEIRPFVNNTPVEGTYDARLFTQLQTDFSTLYRVISTRLSELEAS